MIRCVSESRCGMIYHLTKKTCNIQNLDGYKLLNLGCSVIRNVNISAEWAFGMSINALCREKVSGKAPIVCYALDY